jgi:hypothetical protein
MAKSIDIRCPQCDRLYHADESHLGKSIRCVQCGKILLLDVSEPPATKDVRSPSIRAHSSPETQNSESRSPRTPRNAAPDVPKPYFDWVLRNLNRPQKFVLVLSTFAFLMTALRPPFVFGQKARYGWLWSHSGSRIELTRLLVEWVLIIVTGGVGVLFLSDSGDLAPVRAFRRWWTNRRVVVSGSAAGGQASESSAHHPNRRPWLLYAFGVATIVAVVAATLLLHVKHDTLHLPDVGEPTQSQLNQHPENVATEPIVNQVPAFPPTGDAATIKPKRIQPADPRPKNYNSPPTGTRIEQDVGEDGRGKLTVENGTDEDAVVRLSDATTDQTVRWFFVRAHTSAHLAHIPEGTDRLTFTTGLNWTESEDSFSWHPSYSEFERAFVYSEERDSEEVHFHSISVTLHSVPAGNVKTRAISRQEFLKGYRHVALQRP